MIALLALTLSASLTAHARTGSTFDPLASPGFLPVRAVASASAGPVWLAPAAPAQQAAIPLCIGGQITADNSYIVGVGGPFGIQTVLRSACATTSAQIFSCGSGPESFGLCFKSVRLRSYVYIVAWGDDTVTNGVLATIRVNSPDLPIDKTRHSGSGLWRVFATGIDRDSCTAPTLSEINTQIALANAGMGGGSQTWVGVTPTATGALQVGEMNDTTVPFGSCSEAFPNVCGMATAARWMWYRNPSSTCAFTDGDQGEYLIFRIPISAFL